MTYHPTDADVRRADQELAENWQCWRRAITRRKLDGRQLLHWLRCQHARGREAPFFLWLLAGNTTAREFTHGMIMRVLDESVGNLAAGRTTHYGQFWL